MIINHQDKLAVSSFISRRSILILIQNNKKQSFYNFIRSEIVIPRAFEILCSRRLVPRASLFQIGVIFRSIFRSSKSVETVKLIFRIVVSKSFNVESVECQEFGKNES